MKKTIIWMTILTTGLALAGCTLLPSRSGNEITALVESTCRAVQKDAAGTFAEIMKSRHPYVNKDNPAFYVFVYDTDVNIVAHPRTELVGKNYRGRPDVAGKNFRDEIVDGALKNGTGWVHYLYAKPGEQGMHKKATYYKLTQGSDGKKYVVCCGKYAD